LATPHN